MIIMEYPEVFKECNKLFPYISWGNNNTDQFKQRRLTFGVDSDALSFIDENILKFNDCVNIIWESEDKSVYYLPRKDIEQFIIKVLKEIHTTNELTTKNNPELYEQWNKFLSIKMKCYYVAFPIYGVIVPKVTQFGVFRIFNNLDYKKFLLENNVIPEETVVKTSLIKNELNYLLLEVKAKAPQRAIELSIPNFELFEYAVKFLLHDNRHIDVGIFHYNERNITEGIAFEKDRHNLGVLAGSFITKGALQEINILELFSQNMNFFWDILSRYINGNTTEMENRLINAVRWVGKANNDDSNITQYVQYVFALEALLAYKPEKTFITPSTSFQLAEYAAFIVGETANENIITKTALRKKIFYDVKKIYHIRSQIVHGNELTLNKEAVVTARELIYQVIYSVMSNNTILKFNSIKELSKWIENLKFT